MGRKERRQQAQIRDILRQDSPAPLYEDNRPKGSPTGRSGRGLLFVMALLALAAVTLAVVLVPRLMGTDGLFSRFGQAGGVAGGSPEAMARAPLPQTADAGQSYLDGTLFLGDSNTVRLKMFDLVDEGRVKALAGIGIDGAMGLPFAGPNGRENTMAEEVARQKPERVLVILGTNDLPALSPEAFAEQYGQFLGQLAAASPGTDIIVGAVPPVDLDGARVNDGKVRAYNAALLALCQAQGVAFLDVYAALTDDDGGVPAGVTDGDGIHLTGQALETLLDYYRTHALA